jgi:hypothetical protein
MPRVGFDPMIVLERAKTVRALDETLLFYHTNVYNEKLWFWKYLKKKKQSFGSKGLLRAKGVRIPGLNF